MRRTVKAEEGGQYHDNYVVGRFWMGGISGSRDKDQRTSVDSHDGVHGNCPQEEASVQPDTCGEHAWPARGRLSGFDYSFPLGTTGHALSRMHRTLGEPKATQQGGSHSRKLSKLSSLFKQAGLSNAFVSLLFDIQNVFLNKKKMYIKVFSKVSMQKPI